MTLCVGDAGGELRSYRPADRLQWLLDFSSKAQARGDVVRGSVLLHHT